MSEFIIWGSSGHAKVLFDAITLTEGKVLALFDSCTEVKSVIRGVEIYYGEDSLYDWCDVNRVKDKSVSAISAIGGQRGGDRLRLLELFKKCALLVPSIVHPSAFVSNSVSIGENCHILANASVSAGVVMGDCSIINNLANVDHECILGVGVHVAPGATLCGCVTVGKLTMIGAGSVILPRVKIGDNCIVGAGSVVIENVQNDTVVAGNPANFIRYNV
jgi:sugar O-acyltransferase (sialic acid O-acetyltransferase NeuD family)